MSRFMLGIIAGLVMFCGCVTPQKTEKPAEDPVAKENAAFLSGEPDDKDEMFRVLLTSDGYETVQVGGKETIARQEDKSGDKYFCEELSKYNKINEVREAVVSVSLYPDTGRIMKVRPKKLAALREIDELLVEDVQRWNFVSPAKRSVTPNRFDIRYRIVLFKKQSDEDIIKEVREKMKEKAGQ
jgi:hypothetical protein